MPIFVRKASFLFAASLRSLPHLFVLSISIARLFSGIKKSKTYGPVGYWKIKVSEVCFSKAKNTASCGHGVSLNVSALEAAAFAAAFLLCAGFLEAIRWLCAAKAECVLLLSPYAQCAVPLFLVSAVACLIFRQVSPSTLAACIRDCLETPARLESSFIEIFWRKCNSAMISFRGSWKNNSTFSFIDIRLAYMKGNGNG